MFYYFLHLTLLFFTSYWAQNRFFLYFQLW